MSIEQENEVLLYSVRKCSPFERELLCVIIVEFFIHHRCHILCDMSHVKESESTEEADRFEDDARVVVS